MSYLLSVWLIALLLLVVFPLHADEVPRDPATAVRREGQVMTLPAGMFRGSLTIPPGVSLRGAGYNKTIIDAAGAEAGIRLQGGSGSCISDLTVRNAAIGIAVSGAGNVAVQRVCVNRCTTGLLFEDTQARVANTISAGNQNGLILRKDRGSTVVNCTLADNVNLGLSLPSGNGTVIFNNCLSGSAVGIYLGKRASGLHLDHNLYNCTFTGRFEEERLRMSVMEWADVTGHDRHSPQLLVHYRNPEAGDYTPVTASDWWAGRLTTSDWGVASLSGQTAPTTDIAGNPRKDAPDAGAFEVAPAAPKPSDGTFTITEEEGVKSAGIFTRDGHLIGYLFHNLPFRKGRYPFQFPAQDFQGRPIPAGEYEVRLAQSRLQWEFLGVLPNSQPSGSIADRMLYIAFDKQGNLLMANNYSEDCANLCQYDARGKKRWRFSGADPVQGLAVGEDGLAYVLRRLQFALPRTRLTMQVQRIDPVMGKLAGERNTDTGGQTFTTDELPDGLAIRGKSLVMAQPKHILSLPTDLIDDISVRQYGYRLPAQPVMDSKTNLMWLIAERKRVVALDENDLALAEATPVEEPAAIAVRDGVLAVASYKTGKVHLFDAHDPKALREIGTVGNGEDPFGPLQPARFLFKKAGSWTGGQVRLALGPAGQLAVAEGNRVQVFDQQGKLLWADTCLFNGEYRPAWPDTDRIWSADGRLTAVRDARTGRWVLEAFWDIPASLNRPFFYGTFKDGKAQFGVFIEGVKPPKDILDWSDWVGLFKTTWVRFDGYRSTPVAGIVYDNDQRIYCWRKESNGDGVLDSKDTGEPLRDKDGNTVAWRRTLPLAVELNNSAVLLSNGDLVGVYDYGIQWKRNGLDADGMPVYRYADRQVLPVEPLLSPYTGKEDERIRVTVAAPVGNGESLLNVSLSSDGEYSMGMHHDLGTNLAGLDAAGKVRWFNPSFVRFESIVPYLQVEQVSGLQAVGPLACTMRSSSTDILVFTPDGLGLGSFGMPLREQFGSLRLYMQNGGYGRSFIGRDGAVYLQTMYYMYGFGAMAARFRLRNAAAFSVTSQPVKFQPTREAHANPAQFPITPRVTPLHIPRLVEALPIDGDLEKWRKAGIQPQMVITPATSYGAFDGPQDICAVARVAHLGRDLYLQVLRFDTAKPAQPSPQDAPNGITLAINGGAEGMAFLFTPPAAGKPATLQRGRLQAWKAPALALELSAEQAPRIVKVLPDARDVPERALIEQQYDVDLSACSVWVYECKLPLDEKTYDGALDALPDLTGKTPLYLGLRLRDNGPDQPDMCGYAFLSWPMSYGTLLPKEVSAKVSWE